MGISPVASEHLLHIKISSTKFHRHSSETPRSHILGDRKERWMELSECTSKEQDPQKLSELVAEIDRMLQEKQDRLIRGIPVSTTDAA